MQSGGGAGGGPGWKAGPGPAGRVTSTSSAAASPTSSSPAISASHLGLNSLQQQQIGSRQPLQHQLLRKPEGNEALLAYPSGLQGVFGSNRISSPTPSAMQLPQQAQKLVDLAHHGSNQEAQLRGQAVVPQMLNPAHQAYLQYTLQAAQQKSALAMHSQQLTPMGMVSPLAVMDQEMHMGNLKMQDLVFMQALDQAQASTSKSSSEHFAYGEKQTEQGQQLAPDQKSNGKSLTQGPALGRPMPGNMTRPVQAPETQQGISNVVNNQISMSGQLQAMQAWAQAHNIDLLHPANANLMTQLLPLMQSRMVSQQKANDSDAGAQLSPVPVSKQQVTSPVVARESSVHATSTSDASGVLGSAKTRQAVPPSHLNHPINAGIANITNDVSLQHGRESQATPRQQPVAAGNGMPLILPQNSAANMNQGAEHPLNVKNVISDPEALCVQYTGQSSSQAAASSNEGRSGNQVKSQGAPAQMPQQLGFTKQQSHVLKAQILAFRRLKRGEGALPQELLRAIAPPPLELQVQQQIQPAGGQHQDESARNFVGERPGNLDSTTKDSQCVPAIRGQSSSKQETFVRDEKATGTAAHIRAMPAVTMESTPGSSAAKEEDQSIGSPAKSDQGCEHGVNRTTIRNKLPLYKRKAIAPQSPVSDTMSVKKPAEASAVVLSKDGETTQKYHGPLFDFPFFTRKPDSFGLSMMLNNNNTLSLAYDAKDLLSTEGMEVLSKKRTKHLKKVGDIMAVNLERKRIRPDLVLKLQIEEKKLHLLDLQARVRDEIDQLQQEIMAMPDRTYRKFVRLCERQRVELARQVQASRRALREKQLKSIFQWRKKLLEGHWAIRDARTAHNRGVAKYHERMLREFSKCKDDRRNKRMEALKNNDVDRYREMLCEQQSSIPGEAAERYAVLSSFLTQTEEYLHKLGHKIRAAKNQQEVDEAAKAAAAAAQLQGPSEEEVRAAAACAGEELIIRNRFMEMDDPKDCSSVSKYYNLAHAVNENVIRQPSMLRAGILRDYQLVGLQWMLSLYNNKLNGILADEMGLGKTVQVMALIAYLMEFKGNYGPHLIIVPNAVMVNWKSELNNWLPSVSCIFYVGGKDQRSKLFFQEVSALKFNVLVTTYEFIMYDRSKLSKIDWKYIIIDEAQRMKDRESVLARDLDRYRCQRRLLLTGTPLQNDLKELWSLLNLLLPEVFDNQKAFHDWFSKAFQKEGHTQNAEDDWLETEKKVIIIHRLHQILEPFMLRRRVEDVEGSLPPKVSIVLRCKMSAVQSAIYNWIKSTGTLRLDPAEEKKKVKKNPFYQPKQYKTLSNRCMELRKTCNHPLLSCPVLSNDTSKEFMVKSCGKMWILDRILIKLQRTGHRVLLFSTMTKLLDILEKYLVWRQLVFRRIDGTTSLEDRESAVVDFNSPDSDCFIFLLSIRAAGRGLNLQSADTVVIYDPDPNPKNEEQAVARAYRIGQTREVKVIYMEAVVDKIPSYQKEDELRSGGTFDNEVELAGKDRYMGSIESLIRNNIQQYKIDMADEVINAGRFDQRTTHEERRMTLETLLHDEERYQETVHDVPSLQQVNRMIARSKEEVELFDQMDEELDWMEEMTRHDQLPKWLRATTREVNATITALSKRSSKDTLLGSNIGVESSEMGSESATTERRRGHPNRKKRPCYKELDDEDVKYFEASSEERNEYSAHEEEGKMGDFEDDGSSGADGNQPSSKDQLEEDGPLCQGYEFPQSLESGRNNHVVDEVGSSGSSSGSQKMTQVVSPVSCQKFGSISALDARPGSLSKRMADDLEEWEIAVSGDSLMDHQKSGNWANDHDEGEDEQVLQPRIKGKRSLRVRSHHAVERLKKSGSEMASIQCGESSLLTAQGNHKYQAQSRTAPGGKSCGDLSVSRHDQNEPLSKTRQILPSTRLVNTAKLHGSPKSRGLNCISAHSNDEHYRESQEGKPMKSSVSLALGSKMPEIIQRRCKKVISKLQRRLDKEGHQFVPLLTDLWKRIENSGYTGGSVNSMLNFWKIDKRIDKLEYNGIMELVGDVQFMLKGAMHFYRFSHEVKSEARKVHDLFFDILKIAFPDIDFREVRSALTFSGPASAGTLTSPSQVAAGSNKRPRLINELETEPSPTQKRGHASSRENKKIKGNVSEDSRLGSNSRIARAREQHQQDDAPLLSHPGDLVVCKKRRNDREKSLVRPRTGSVGPVSPQSTGPSIRSPGLGSSPKDTRLAQQAGQAPGWAGQQAQQRNGSCGSVGWANPVKRLRTDYGKRRPSHP